MNDFTDVVKDEAGAIGFMLKVFGFEPKKHYTYEALRELEDMINKTYPQGHKPKPTTLIPFGHYLMQTLVKNLPNSKVYAKVEEVWDIRVEYKQKDGSTMVAYPFRRIHRFWRKREDSIASVLEMTTFMAENDVASPEIRKRADKDGWIMLPGGTMFRLFEATEEQARDILGKEGK